MKNRLFQLYCSCVIFITPISLLYSTPDVIETYFPNAQSIGSGWYESTWFGCIYPESDTSYWVNHEYHGWILLTGPGPSDMWVWEDNMKWWWQTTSSYYPDLKSDDNRWFYYYDGTSYPRAYWDYNRSDVAYDLYYDVPDYYPSYWNDNSTIEQWNYCYNYACNVRTDTRAQPGGGFLLSIPLSAGMLDYAIRADGIEEGTPTGPVPQGKSRIFCVFFDHDFHFYRQDDNGAWSHKPGAQPARNVDADYPPQPIINPEEADRGPYVNEVGYYFVDSDDAQGQGDENIQ